MESIRKSSYKTNAINTNESRVRRHEVTIELRKTKKEDQLFKRRNIKEEDLVSPIKDNNAPSPVTMSLEDIVLAMESTDPDIKFLGLQNARKMLSREQNPPIDLMINHGIVPICVEFLKDFSNPSLQYEAAWALTNIASGNNQQTRCVIDNNAVAPFVALLKAENKQLADQAVWALGNIAGDGPDARDIVLQNNVIDGILTMMKDEKCSPLLRNVVWLMSNLCRNKNPSPPFDEIRCLLPVLSQLLTSPDAQILADACWALSYVTDDDNCKIQAVIDAGAVPRLICLLGVNNPSIIVPALRSVGNIVTGTDQQTDVVINAGGLPRLAHLLRHPKHNIVKEAAWTISNIVAGNQTQIQSVLDADIFTEIRHVLEEGDFKSQKEAAWAVTNTTTSGSPEQIIDLIEKYQLMRPFCNLLDSKDPRTVKVVLTGLSNVFALAEKLGNLDSFALMIESINGVDKLEKLQSHENEEIYKKAYALIDTYFSETDKEEDNLAPQEVDGTLKFNADRQNPPQGGFSF